MKKLKRKSDIQ